MITTQRPRLAATATAAAVTLAGVAPATGGEPPAIGPDLSVSRVGLTAGGEGADDFIYWGAADGVRAFTIASTACNLGDAPADFIAVGGSLHPVVGQNLFRLRDGRFEHVGQAWVQHTVCAVNEPTCGTCQPTSCSSLGAGCATTTYPSLGGDPVLLGPKIEIDPLGITGAGGTHEDPHATPTGPDVIRGRLQVRDDDIRAGGRFYAEVQLVTHDEPLEDRVNNASWREVVVALDGMTGVERGQASVRFEQPAILAWREADPLVEIALVDLPDGGRFIVAHRAIALGDASWSYEYAIQNLNAGRAARGWAVPVPVGVTVTDAGFHDVDHHSGSPVDGADWPSELDRTGDPAELRWRTSTFDTDPYANALRWGTLYNFRFVADAAPAPATARLELFVPGAPDAVLVDVLGPGGSCRADLDGDRSVGFEDLLTLLAAWGPCPGCVADLTGDDTVGFEDLLVLLAGWGPCG